MVRPQVSLQVGCILCSFMATGHPSVSFECIVFSFLTNYNKCVHRSTLFMNKPFFASSCFLFGAASPWDSGKLHTSHQSVCMSIDDRDVLFILLNKTSCTIGGGGNITHFLNAHLSPTNISLPSSLVADLFLLSWI